MFPRVSGAIQGDGGAIQPYEVSSLFQPILVDASYPAENRYSGILSTSRRSFSRITSRPALSTTLELLIVGDETTREAETMAQVVNIYCVE